MGAAVDPFSAGLMALGGVASATMSGPKVSSVSAPYNSVFDASGWVVNTGSGSASNQQDKSASVVPALLKNPLVLLALVAGVVWYLHK